MTSAESCVFCAIVGERLEASRVVETEHLIAIMDVDPVTPGHVLVVPREHLPALADLPDEIASEMFDVARRVAEALRRSPLRCEGVNLFYADGEVAFQEVDHAHLHVIPRYPNDGFTLGARWGSDPARAELDEQAAAIRAAWGTPG